MTVSAIGYVAAVAIFFGGAFLAVRGDEGRRAPTLAAALVLAVVVGWLSWLLGTSA